MTIAPQGIERNRHVMETLATTAPSPVLNQTLYDRMVKQFGSVIVAKQGEPMFGGGLDFDGRRTSYKPLSSGEYYRICCPFCLRRGAVDTKHRLWINHRWGVGLDEGAEFYDPSEKFWWMAVCYNESCLQDAVNRKELRTILYGGIGREIHGPTIKIGAGKKFDGTLGVVDYPGRCQRIDTLSVDHRAYQYILSRGLDPIRLGQTYDVSYCHESSMFPVAAAKLIVPIYMNGQMVSWQARAPYDIDWKAAGQPKYYNCPGTNKRLMLYGAQAAVGMRFCIVVEGVTDVWKIGPGAVSILGKSMAVQQASFIKNAWPIVILALDADAGADAEKTKKMLESGFTGGATTVVTVTMPEGLDPASIDSEYFWDLVYRSCTDAGVDLLQ